jgi:hypothetical protein
MERIVYCGNGTAVMSALGYTILHLVLWCIMYLLEAGVRSLKDV